MYIIEFSDVLQIMYIFCNNLCRLYIDYIEMGSIVFRHNLCLMIFQYIIMWLIKLNK